MKSFVKRIVEMVPYSIGSKLVNTPYSLRLGSDYNFFKKLIFTNDIDGRQYVIEHFSKIFEYAKNSIPFYNRLYEEAGVLDLKINSLSDIEKVPIIDKDTLRNHLHDFDGALKLNTGGSSGSPFTFYVDKNAFAREWAHMHYIWSLKDYKYTDLKVTLRGKDLGDKNIVYNPVHNEFIINTYKNVSDFKNEIVSLFNKRTIKYIHGYPSAIYNFLNELDPILSKEEKKIIRSNLKSCFLGSEYPMPHITKYLSTIWNLDYISWYGHSEMCILAYDQNKTNEYQPFHTYGYTEVVDSKLIGTSFHNYDMPLIRYDTGDIVEPTYQENGLIKHFKISQGRNGDYIIDKNHKQIPLTALIFGRHHEVFNFVQFIQISQDSPGVVTFYITTKETDVEKIKNGLNLKNVDIDFKICRINIPIKTKAGKTLLKIKSKELNETNHTRP
ncbi:phenylacetate--CoA ligase family protein [Flagellimonas marinaquae]